MTEDKTTDTVSERKPTPAPLSAEQATFRYQAEPTYGLLARRSDEKAPPAPLNVFSKP
jgi:hypothetical protein